MQFWNLKPCGQNTQEQMARWIIRQIERKKERKKDRQIDRQKERKKKIDRLVRNDKYIER